MSVLACPACLNTLWDYLLLWHHGKNKCMCCDLIFLHSVLWVFLPSLNSFVFESKTERECVCVCVCVFVSVQQPVHSQARWASYWPFYRRGNDPCHYYKHQRFRMRGCVFVREFACVSVRVCKHFTIDLLAADVPNVAFKQNTGAMLNICATGTFMSGQTHPFLLHVPAHTKIDHTDPQQQITNRHGPPYTHVD